jgi:glyoxylase-like metal-dependent hydrolase (beta-lactamase superfamily II)
MGRGRELGPDLIVYSLVGEAASHVVVRRGRSLLVDCHSAALDRWLARHALPPPDLILHTHVQPEHTREGDRFPGATLLVHEPLRELATDPDGWRHKAQTVWEHPEEWGATLGREPYGIAGSITLYPPDPPLPVTGVFRVGDRIPWQDLTLEVVALPAHGRYPVGFFLEHGGRRLAFFCGDLICHPGQLVNFYDLEENYGGASLAPLPALLRALADEAPQPWFPSTGLPLEDGPQSARRLAEAIEGYLTALRWRSGDFQPPTTRDDPLIGRYRRRHPGVYQNDTFGNCILFITDQGRGLMVDPGPCEFEWPDRKTRFIEDLRRFEQDAGLKRIELVLITHPHGDHYDLAPLVLERYPGCRVGALDLTARVIEAPWDYPYPALLPWYHLGFDHLPVDMVLTAEKTFQWAGVTIRPVHLPGHCYCHGGFLLTFNGLRLAVTGDTIQSRGESVTLSFLTANHVVPDAAAGSLRAYRRLVGEGVGLNLGGHGSHFIECTRVYQESIRRIEHAEPFLRRLVPGGDLRTACLRPGWPRWPLDEQLPIVPPSTTKEAP